MAFIFVAHTNFDYIKGGVNNITQKEKVLNFLEEAAVVPLLFDELVTVLSVPDDKVNELGDILEELMREGLVIKTKKKRFGAAIKLGYVKGRFLGTERGFGFVERAGEEDLFIPPDSTKGAMHGDLVLAKITSQATESKRQEGLVEVVLERAKTVLVGTFEKHKASGFVVLDDKRIGVDLFIPENETLGAKNGDKVVAEIVRIGTGRNPEGKITEVLGNRLDVGVDVLAIIRQHGICENFPKKVLKEAKEVSSVSILNDAEKRADFKDHLIFTIDGEDAKDLDDAVEIEKLSNGNYRLGVHIADVGHYVPRGSLLDKEAFNRGTSVYLVDRVIPMLPVELSNGICSLSEGKERLALSVIMEIDPSGKVISHEILKSVICSKARMTYSGVTAILNGDKELSEKYSFLTESIFLMRELKDILRKKRMARGSIDFDFPEAKIKLDENGKPIAIEKYEHSESNHIIEEFMLVCNETVAEEMFFREMPFVYRVHEVPTEEKIKDFAEFAAAFGYSVKRTQGKIHPKEFQKLLGEIKGTREERIISTVMLRSLMKAQYSAENMGHFGLAAKYYCHFTSPIRRYPDLVIHRIIADVISAKEVDSEELMRFVTSAAAQSSERELCAMEAERDTDDLKKAEYMSERLGEVFDGVISSVTSFGMFVELDNTIEGLVRMTDLDDDYYIFDEKKRILIGEHTHRIYQIGDLVSVQVARADKESRRIDFVLYDENNEGGILYKNYLPPKKRTNKKAKSVRKKEPEKRYLKKKKHKRK